MTTRNPRRENPVFRKAIDLTKLLPVVLCGLLASCSDKSDEPIYQGRNLSEWLMDYSNPLRNGDPRDPKMQMVVSERLRAAQQAVKTIGTNAIPKLLVLIQSTNPGRRDMACAGFMLLGAQGSSAMPQLLKLTRHENSHIRLLAAKSVVFINPADKETLVPIFERLSADADADNRKEATNYLQVLLFLPHS